MIKWNKDVKNGLVFAKWTVCPYCNAVYPDVITLSDTHEIYLLDTDEDGWPSQYGVRLVPALIKLENGVVVKKIEGVLSREQVREFIKENS
jgi:thioredoxin-like negative regulator of GroEL